MALIGAPSHSAPLHSLYQAIYMTNLQGLPESRVFVHGKTYSTPKVVLSLSKLVAAFCALFESDTVLADKREMSILYQMLTKAPETGLTPSAYSLPWSLYSWRESHKPFKKAISSVHKKIKKTTIK